MIRFFILALFLLTFVACDSEHQINKLEDPDEPTELVNSLGYGFEEVYNQIFEPKCFPCHEKEYGSYEIVKEDLIKIREQVETNAMPKWLPPLDASLKTLLFDWIDAGAPER